MSPQDRLSIVGPESKGAALLPEPSLREFLQTTIDAAERECRLCALVVVRLTDLSGCPAPVDDQHQAAQMMSKLMRQVDAVGTLQDGSVAIVLHNLDRRGDAHVMLDRIESFARAVGLPWALVIGAGVYPLSGRTTQELWDACYHDLQGAMTSDTWEHLIPRDTLMTRTAG